jgi:Ca2+-binding RTX toxin-like protein
MKNFNITLSDQQFLLDQVSVPIVRIVRYQTDGTPIYGYTVPVSGFHDPLTGLTVTTFNGVTLPVAGTVVELGKLGTFDVFNTSWSLFLPPVVTAAGTTLAGVGEPFGIRNAQGLFNNISLASAATWGSAYSPFARSTSADYSNYSQQSITNTAFKLRLKIDTTLQDQVNGLAGVISPSDLPTAPITLWGNLTAPEKALVQDSTYGVVVATNGNVDLSQRYANPFLTVYDYTPRLISQTVDSHEALIRIDAASIAAGNGGVFTDNLVYQITDINSLTGEKLVGGYNEAGIATEGGLYFKEDYVRNLNTLSGDPTLTGWQVLFGQFFDHGLDAIAKGGNRVNGVSAKIYIPLSTDDPLYRAPNPLTGDPGYTKLSISRATVANPEAAGADGMFQTADDILSPGVDGIYGNSDDVIGKTNPNYINHTSPYIDQSQTYGSDDNVTNLLREWVIDASGNYNPGMRLFDGQTLANPWLRQNPDGTFALYEKENGGYNADGTINASGNFARGTKSTLPTLNELRAYLLQTGRDDLSWGDINNLRVRDDKGHVLDLDTVTGGLQAKSSGHTLLADFLPRLDAAHLLIDPFATTPGHTNVLSEFDASHIDRSTDNTSLPGSYISDYINLQSGQPTALGADPANGAILNEILLRSIGDHYVAGDGRANENFGLTAIHHVWHENHNWQIDNLINVISQQQAADPTHTVAHNFQNYTNIQDIKGNYLVSVDGPISWNQEKMFQAATLINQTEYQHVAIDQYARGLSPNIPLFVLYDSGINADVTLEYSQGAYRFGHSQLRETIDTLDPNGSLTAAVTHYALEQAFLDPAGFAKLGPTAIAQGMTRQASSEIDEIVTPALQQRLLGQPQDLAAINIARGRDLGLPTLNKLRADLSGGLTAQLSSLNQKLNASPGDTKLRETIDKTIVLQAGLLPYISWDDFGNNLLHPEALVNFIAAYSFDGDLKTAETLMKLVDGTVHSALSDDEKAIVADKLHFTTTAGATNDQIDLNYAIQAATFVGSGNTANKGFDKIDAWNGGLAEKHVFLGQLGSTFDAIFADQMTRLINGDRFYYFWRLQLGLPIFTELSSAVSTEQFKDVIERTTGAKHLVGDVFLMADSYVELGELPDDGKPRDHKYGDLIDAVGNTKGVYSTFSKGTFLNGTTISIGSTQYIYDGRPDVGTNPDGTASKGFNAHEVIGGTRFNDYIDAGDGDDTEYGDDGDDVLLGNAGADHIYGEAGNDTIFGGSLPDFLDGGTGDDVIHGGDDADVIIGAEGNDSLFGENFTDELHGNAGDDYLNGGLDADFIYGGEGQDIVVGEEGLDTTFGEWGDDRMFGGAGPDQLFGGYGDDILNGGAGGQNQNLNVDECLGEFGFNIVSFSDVNIPLNHSADLNQQNVNLSNVTPFGQLWVNIQGVEGSAQADAIIGYNGSGTVDPNLANNWLIGGGGNDTITTGSGDDVIVGDSVRLDTLVGTYSGGTLQNNGLLSGTDRHFLGLLKSVPGFTFGDTVTIDAGGITYNHQLANGADTVKYAGDRYNFDITTFTYSENSTNLVGYRIKDVITGNETGTKGDIVLSVENFSFNGQVFTASNLISPSNGTMKLSGYASANQPATPNTFQLTANITDVNGYSHNNATYKWEYSTNGTTWTTIAGATGATFKPTNPTGTAAVPIGAFIHSIADYRDDLANLEHVISTPSERMGRYVNGTAAANTITVNNSIVANNSLNGNSTDYQDVIFGLGGNDTINAGGGSDYIDGGAGSDSMIGGTGDDTYVVDVAGDIIIENADEGNDTVQSSINWSLAALDNVENLTLTGTANRNGTGNALANILTGNSGNNILDGGAGADTMSGGAGNDTYIVDDASDVVTDTAGASDTVQSSVTYALAIGNGIENLTLTGAANINGTGNELANTLTGNSGINTLTGGDGNDIYIIDAGDFVMETSDLAAGGIDEVRSSVDFTLGANIEKLTLMGTANINGTGNTLANTLTGNSSNNTLDGGTGADTMSGGNGNDTYIVDNASDSVVETSASLATGGTDEVRSSVTYILGANIENLTLKGTANINGTGNNLANTLIGNSGNNILDGGLGNDIYIVDAGDFVVETSVTGGTDEVRSSVTYTLGANIEKLTLTNTANINGTGNTLANTLIGNSGNNILDGGLGSDTITGGVGTDTFVLHKPTTATPGFSTITDFVVGEKLQISAAEFGGGLTAGTVSAAQIRIGTSNNANALAQRFIYNTSNGNLYFDADGSGGAAAVQIARLTGMPGLSEASFNLV